MDIEETKIGDTVFKAPEKHRLLNHSDSSYGNNGVFQIDGKLRIIISDGGGWEHASVSLAHRIPRWPEMCKVKDIFWDEEDCVMQYHPAKSEYVNCHPFVLHLWRPVGISYPIPPSIFVGPKS